MLGGYSQKDVQEVARCFTGWTLKEQLGGGATSAKDFFRSYVYEFRPDKHDVGNKHVLGRTIRGRGGIDGEREGEEVLDLLAAHPSTARTASSPATATMASSGGVGVSSRRAKARMPCTVERAGLIG